MSSRNIWYNLLTSGTYDSFELVKRSRVIFLNTVMIVGLLTLTSFSLISYGSGNLSLSIATASVSLIVVFGFIYIRTTKNFIVGDYIASQSIFLLYCYLYISGGEEGSGVLWLFSFPLIALFLHGTKIGTAMSAALLALIAVGLFHPAVGIWDYSVQYGLRILGSYVFIFLFALIYEMVRKATQEKLTAANNELKHITQELSLEKIQTDAVFKNVQEGIFLMDEHHIVSPAYSTFLEDLLETDRIQGRSLKDLIGPYLTKKNYDALHDYLPMLLDETLNPELIRSINPLEEVRIAIPIAEGQVIEKNLRFTFDPIHIDNQTHVLGIVHDITEQVELAAQIATEQQKHQRDMETLFQVLHVDPRLMGEFIEDTEQELDTINNLLRDKKISIPDTLSTMFQSVHSIKGNALLLGLEELGITLHKLEQHIQDTMDIEDCSWKDMLQLTVSLGVIQQAIEDTNSIIQKLMTFQDVSAEAGLSQAGLLERAIRRITDRESTTSGHPAEISFSNIDLMPDYGRRAIRDILVQMIRNSFAHGFESPADRLKNGKPETGTILVAFKRKSDNSIELRYSDDGAGIDYEKIRRIAARKFNKSDTEAAMMTEAELIRLLFHPHFSTADNVNTSAGRGVGMSLVQSKAREIGGRIAVQSGRGKGFRLSLTLSEN